MAQQSDFDRSLSASAIILAPNSRMKKLSTSGMLGAASGRNFTSSRFQLHRESVRDGPPVENDSFEQKSKKEGSLNKCLHRTCLHPKLSLKHQLFLSFGLVTTLSLFFVMTTSILTVRAAGDHVKSLSRRNLEHWSQENVRVSSRILAETLTKDLGHVLSLTAILVETTKDRFVGYPDDPGYADDSLVPFRDMVSGRNIYPLKASAPLPLEWELEPTVITDKNAKEHLGFLRSEWYLKDDLSTATANLRMQGACDPNETDPSEKRYYANCTDANNDVSVGGVVNPTGTMDLIHKKVSDYATAILKPLYEAHFVVKIVGIFFANSGAGAVVAYPAITADGSASYISSGCDWLREPNPMDPMNKTRSIGSEEMIARCRPAGTKVFNRDFNPLERDWCREQALDPGKPHLFGPYKDAFTHDLWLFAFGQAVYDRVTNEFIACTLADVPIDHVGKGINIFEITNTSEIVLLRWESDGTVTASEKQNPSYATSNATLTVDDELFSEMKQRFTLSYEQDGNRSSYTYDPVFITGGKVFASYPVPVPPKTYDPDYVPEFAIILAVEGAEVFAEVNDLDDVVEKEMLEMIQNILIAGSVGLVTVILCIYVVSLHLTRPTEWMHNVSDQIVQNVGSPDTDINFEQSAWLRFSPRTEITLLVQQFQNMVERFSGLGTAKLHTHKVVEIKNPFVLHDKFESLYSKRENQSFKHTYQSGNQHENTNGGRAGNVDRLHWGPNFHSIEDDSTYASSLHQELDLVDGNEKIAASPLFWWILGAIAFPLLITMITISAYVTWNISNELPRLVVAVEGAFVGLNERSLYTLAKARAVFSARVISPSFRDVHLMSRIAGWLFFGGLQKANSVTAMTTASEECKKIPFPRKDPDHGCPYVQNLSNTPCDCKWKRNGDSESTQCFDYDQDYDQDSRYLQQLWWFGSKQDAWPNGDVNFTSYPDVATSAANTSWWSDWNAVPGAELGFNATNSNTIYEILLSLSAMSMVQIPIFNYQNGRRNTGTLGTYTAFEDSGLYSGYTGCADDILHPYASQFQSNNDTAADVINSTLCPLGKYGYDPRCRPWYKGGKLTHTEGSDPLYVSPPYHYVGPSGYSYVGQTAVLPLRDKERYIGQATLDFSVVPIIEALTQEETPLSGNGFHVLISTPRYDFGTDTDTVVGPDFDLMGDLAQGGKPSIEKSVLPFDVDACDNGVGVGCDNLAEFQKIVEDMRAGMSESTRFTRTTASGGSEVVFWAFSAVTLPSFSSLDNSDISRGVIEHSASIFSVALAETVPGLHDSFNSVHEELDRTVRIAIGVLATMISLALVCVVFMSARVTVSIISPVSQLLRLVTKINKRELNDDFPEIYGRSSEVTKIHDTFERTYMVIRLANVAFFSGDLGKAYETLQNALALFTKLNNEKAIGIANNNLGNTMLSMYRTMKKTTAIEICGLTQVEVIANGVSYFKSSIDRGEDALAKIDQEEGWSTNYLVFMQQLSNRYFNRAVFLLAVKKDHPKPDEAEAQGFADLSTSKDMDREVVDNGDHQGFKGDGDVYFQLLLGRIKGILRLLETGHEDEWGVEELFEDARKELVAALQEPGHILFRNIEPAGQMQLLDTVLIEHYLCQKDNEKAALVAIRMLIEDDFVIAGAATWAIKALVNYIPILKGQDLGGDDPSDIQCALFQYRQRIAETLSPSQSPQSNLKNDGRLIMMRESAKQSKHADMEQF